jgi:hypothetical protein
MCTCRMQRRSPRSPAQEAAPAASRGPDVVVMPRGPAVAAEAFAWLNRQLTWQSRLADLEGVRTSRPPARTS